MKKEVSALKSEMLKRNEQIRQLKEENADLRMEHRRNETGKEMLQSEVERMRKELEVKSIGDSVSRTVQLQDQNRRLVNENNRLREEINVRDVELEKRGAPGYSAAQFVDTSKANKTTEEKLQLAYVENKRVNDELRRVRAALEETHEADTGSRFKDQHVTGAMIETFKDVKSRKRKTVTIQDDKLRKGVATAHSNETDDLKLMKARDAGKRR